MLNDLILHAVLATTGVLVGSMWMGPHLGPAVRKWGLVLVAAGLAADALVKAVS